MQYTARELAGNSTGKDSMGDMLFSRANAFRMVGASRRHLAIRVARFEIAPISIIKVASSGHEIDLTDDDVTTVMLPLAGVVGVSTAHDHYQADRTGSLTFLPSGRRTGVKAPSAGLFEALMLKMPMANLPTDDDGKPLPPSSYALSSSLVPTSAEAIASLRELLDYVMTDFLSRNPVLGRPHAARLVEVLVREQFLALFDDVPELSVAPVSTLKVQAAEEFMRANFTEALSVKEIADTVGVGVRNLQMTFRETAGVSPRVRLSEIRLDAAYLRLIAGTEKTVTEVALECGVAHLGRFSQAYRRRFGELPSQTRRRGRNKLVN